MEREKNSSLTEELGTLGSVLRIPFEAMLAHNWRQVRDQGFHDLRIAQALSSGTSRPAGRGLRTWLPGRE
jgi:hypothetical protein